MKAAVLFQTNIDGGRREGRCLAMTSQPDRSYDLSLYIRHRNCINEVVSSVTVASTPASQPENAISSVFMVSFPISSEVCEQNPKHVPPLLWPISAGRQW
jgi:hypothetical protein